MSKQMRNNLIKLVAFSAVVLMLAVLVEYKWDFLPLKNGNGGQFQAEVTAEGIPGSSEEAGAPLDLDELPDWIFSDVASTHPDARAIYELKSREIMKGRDDGTFQPDKILLKVETLVVAMRAAGITADASLAASPLKDVQDKKQWFYNDVNTAYHEGIVKGDKDGKFNPAKLANLAEFLAMLTSALDVDLSDYAGAAGTPWYTTYANYANGNGLIDGEFSANHEVSRAEAAEITWKLLLILGKY